jgi:hypothetical protein
VGGGEALLEKWSGQQNWLASLRTLFDQQHIRDIDGGPVGFAVGRADVIDRQQPTVPAGRLNVCDFKFDFAADDDDYDIVLLFVEAVEHIDEILDAILGYLDSPDIRAGGSEAEGPGNQQC